MFLVFIIHIVYNIYIYNTYDFKAAIFLGRFADTMQTCKGICFFKRTFFAEGRPDGVRKYGKMRAKYRNIRPVWTRPSQKDLENTHIFFFSRPSVHLSKLFQGEWMCSNPVYILQKCRNVQMFAPASHCKKQAKV